MERKLTIAANVAILVVSVLLIFALVRNELRAKHSASVQPPEASQLVGKAFPLAAPWSSYKHTVVLVLSIGCHYCAASGPFYQQLTRYASEHQTNVVALLPQPKSESVKFLSELGVNISFVEQADPRSVGVSGTPTLLLVDKKGVVQHVFVGQLPEADQTEVISLLS
jgi:hypothetical protein